MNLRLFNVRVIVCGLFLCGAVGLTVAQEVKKEHDNQDLWIVFDIHNAAARTELCSAIKKFMRYESPSFVSFDEESLVLTLNAHKIASTSDTLHFLGQSKFVIFLIWFFLECFWISIFLNPDIPCKIDSDWVVGTLISQAIIVGIVGLLVRAYFDGKKIVPYITLSEQGIKVNTHFFAWGEIAHVLIYNHKLKRNGSTYNWYKLAIVNDLEQQLLTITEDYSELPFDLTAIKCLIEKYRNYVAKKSA
ncbi:MAG: hypothetical protein US69_C0002G0087 [candidate division TM6 bacterium GW2011_GWF2_38_10]|nr:MAG: hypothetical protein US69_C0002G0087 [candidate division TM6 bacterium GW2011_GWF2_38_10]